MKPKVLVKPVWKTQNKCDTAWGTAREEEGQKWLDTILEHFIGQPCYFQPPGPSSQERLLNPSKQKSWKLNFIIPLNTEKHKLKSDMGIVAL